MRQSPQVAAIPPPLVRAFPVVADQPDASDTGETRIALFGCKGAGLLLMASLEMPVPPGFVISTGTRALTPALRAAVAAEVDRLARRIGLAREQLVVAVRSGAAKSMPGMLDTVLDVQLAPGPDGLSDLYRAIEAVWESWHSPTARTYRRIRRFDEDAGTAVVVQAMVDGTAEGFSGTGVLFTRDPSSGKPVPTGEFLLGGRGPELVLGVRTPRPLAVLARAAPTLYRQLTVAAAVLEALLGDLCEIEFTVESGRLWLLQVRRGPRTVRAALRIAVDLAVAGVISRNEAVRRGFDPGLGPLASTRMARPAATLCRGLSASPGAAAGRIALDLPAAQRLTDAGHAVILVRHATEAADIAAMVLAAGILTAVGGVTSHAAVIARELGVPCVCGAAEFEIDLDLRTVRFPGRELAEGMVISIDGTQGIVAEGEHEFVADTAVDDLVYQRLLTEWAGTEF